MRFDDSPDQTQVDDAFLYEAFDFDPSPTIEFITRLVGQGSYRVLDVGCGPGRLLLPLAQLGWDVVGLEPNASFCLAAQRKGFNVRLGGFGHINYAEEFDLILAVNDPYQYVLSLDGRADALRRAYRALRPHGHLLLDMANYLWILAHLREFEPIVVEFRGVKIARSISHEIDFHNAVWTHTDEFEVLFPEGRPKRMKQAHKLSIFGYPELEWLLANADLLRSKPAEFRHGEPWNSGRTENDHHRGKDGVTWHSSILIVVLR